MSKDRQTCFVIMPFSKTTDRHTEEYWTRHFETFLKPLIEENPQLEARRSEPLRGDILREIISDLVNARMVVVDLTDHNPNVFWELGVRQSFKHGTVTIAEVGTKLPFDVGGKGTIYYYPKDHLKMAEFRTRVKKALKDCIANPDRPDSPVLDSLSGRGTLFEIFRKDEAIRRLEAVISECNRNIKIMRAVLKTVRANRKDPSKRSFSTFRLGVAAAELLTTGRYVEEDQDFFEEIEGYAAHIIATNTQLNIWELNQDSTEEWFLTSRKKSPEEIKDVRDLITAVRNKIIKRH